MRGVAAQEHAPVAKTIGEHPPPGPVFLPERLELERGADAENLPNGAIAIDSGGNVAGPQKMMDEPSLATVNCKDEPA